MFASIGTANQLRSTIIEKSIKENAKEITLPILPYSDYCWTTVPETEGWELSFKRFYHIPEDVILHFE